MSSTLMEAAELAAVMRAFFADSWHCASIRPVLLRAVNTMDWRSRIVSDAAVARGAACIRGTRIPVSVVLDNLAAGLSAEEIILSYPSLSLDDVRASLAYGAGLARER